MARKTLEVPIEAAGRDLDKLFIITEWPAKRAENWGTRAVIAMCRAGASIAPPAPKGMSGLLAVGGVGSMLMYIDSDEVTTLLEELMECIKIQPDKNKAFVRPLVEDDIEEVATRLYLKQEVFSLHTGFTFAEIKSKLTSALRDLISSVIQTSPPPLES